VLSRLTAILHRNPVLSTVFLLATGMALVLGSMAHLSRETTEQLTKEFVGTYLRSLDTFQAAYFEQRRRPTARQES
jgi:hypothetical protein